MKKMNFTFEILQMEKFGGLNLASPSIKICCTAAVLVILALGIIVQKQLYTFLKSRSKRFVDKIILLNFYVQNVTNPPLLFYIILLIWMGNPSKYISEIGCHVFSIILQCNCLLDRSTSFFINLFRYVCIVHDDFLKNFNIHPKVSKISIYRYLYSLSNVNIFSKSQRTFLVVLKMLF